MGGELVQNRKDSRHRHEVQWLRPDRVLIFAILLFSTGAESRPLEPMTRVEPGKVLKAFGEGNGKVGGGSTAVQAIFPGGGWIEEFFYFVNGENKIRSHRIAIIPDPLIAPDSSAYGHSVPISSESTRAIFKMSLGREFGLEQYVAVTTEGDVHVAWEHQNSWSGFEKVPGSIKVGATGVPPKAIFPIGRYILVVDASGQVWSHYVSTMTLAGSGIAIQKPVKLLGSKVATDPEPAKAVFLMDERIMVVKKSGEVWFNRISKNEDGKIQIEEPERIPGEMIAAGGAPPKAIFGIVNVITSNRYENHIMVVSAAGEVTAHRLNPPPPPPKPKLYPAPELAPAFRIKSTANGLYLVPAYLGTREDSRNLEVQPFDPAITRLKMFGANNNLAEYRISTANVFSWIFDKGYIRNLETGLVISCDPIGGLNEGNVSTWGSEVTDRHQWDFSQISENGNRTGYLTTAYENIYQDYALLATAHGNFYLAPSGDNAVRQSYKGAVADIPKSNSWELEPATPQEMLRLEIHKVVCVKPSSGQDMGTEVLFWAIDEAISMGAAEGAGTGLKIGIKEIAKHGFRAKGADGLRLFSLKNLGEFGLSQAEGELEGIVVEKVVEKVSKNAPERVSRIEEKDLVKLVNKTAFELASQKGQEEALEEANEALEMEINTSISGAFFNGIRVLTGDPDDLEIRVNKNSIWPNGGRDSRSIDTGETLVVDVDYLFPAKEGIIIELIEKDSGSGDDSLGTIVFSSKELVGLDGRETVEDLIVASRKEKSVFLVSYSLSPARPKTPWVLQKEKEELEAHYAAEKLRLAEVARIAKLKERPNMAWELYYSPDELANSANYQKLARKTRDWLEYSPTPLPRTRDILPGTWKFGFYDDRGEEVTHTDPSWIFTPDGGVTVVGSDGGIANTGKWKNFYTLRRVRFSGFEQHEKDEQEGHVIMTMNATSSSKAYKTELWLHGPMGFYTKRELEPPQGLGMWASPNEYKSVLEFHGQKVADGTDEWNRQSKEEFLRSIRDTRWTCNDFGIKEFTFEGEFDANGEANFRNWFPRSTWKVTGANELTISIPVGYSLTVKFITSKLYRAVDSDGLEFSGRRLGPSSFQAPENYVSNLPGSKWNLFFANAEKDRGSLDDDSYWCDANFETHDRDGEPVRWLRTANDLWVWEISKPDAVSLNRWDDYRKYPGSGYDSALIFHSPDNFTQLDAKGKAVVYGRRAVSDPSEPRRRVNGNPYQQWVVPERSNEEVYFHIEGLELRNGGYRQGKFDNYYSKKFNKTYLGLDGFEIGNDSEISLISMVSPTQFFRSYKDGFWTSEIGDKKGEFEPVVDKNYIDNLVGSMWKLNKTLIEFSSGNQLKSPDGPGNLHRVGSWYYVGPNQIHILDSKGGNYYLEFIGEHSAKGVKGDGKTMVEVTRFSESETQAKDFTEGLIGSAWTYFSYDSVIRGELGGYMATHQFRFLSDGTTKFVEEGLAQKDIEAHDGRWDKIRWQTAGRNLVKLYHPDFNQEIFLHFLSPTGYAVNNWAGFPEYYQEAKVKSPPLKPSEKPDLDLNLEPERPPSGTVTDRNFIDNLINSVWSYDWEGESFSNRFAFNLDGTVKIIVVYNPNYRSADVKGGFRWKIVGPNQVKLWGPKEDGSTKVISLRFTSDSLYETVSLDGKKIQGRRYGEPGTPRDLTEGLHARWFAYPFVDDSKGDRFAIRQLIGDGTIQSLDWDSNIRYQDVDELWKGVTWDIHSRNVVRFVRPSSGLEMFMHLIPKPMGEDEINTWVGVGWEGFNRKEQIFASSPLSVKEENSPLSTDTEGRRAGDWRRLGGLEMIWCPAGEFTMRDDDQVKLTRGFWIAKTELTQREWKSVMGSNPSKIQGDDLPVETVDWDDAQQFLKKMNESQPLTKGWKWALPTEAQWEYACRAGTSGPIPGAGYTDEVAWYSWNSSGTTQVVATKRSNPWGLYDMLGNVSEWCFDWYGADSSFYGTAESIVDPVVSSPPKRDGNPSRVIRGGHWADHPREVTSSIRYWDSYSSPFYGFRPVAVSVAP